MIRVIDFFLENDIFDHSKTQVAEEAEVSFNTMEKFWDKLEKFKIVKKTRKVGKSQLYQLNKDSPIVEKILEIDKKLMLESIDKSVESEIEIT